MSAVALPVRTHPSADVLSSILRLIFVAFGFSAGYAGSALAIKNWAWQLTHPEGGALPSEVPYANQDLLIESVKETVEAGKKVAGRLPKVLVIGAVGYNAQWTV